MGYTKVFYNQDSKLKAVWRILIFILLLSIALLPLLYLNNKLFQFIGASVILIFGLYVNSKYLDKRDFKDYGLIASIQSLKYWIVGCAFGLGAVLFMLLIGSFFGMISIAKQTGTFNISLIALFGLKMLLVAFLEETFFRGYLYTSLVEVFKSKSSSGKKGDVISLLVSSALFGLAHFDNTSSSILSAILLMVNGIVWFIPLILTKNLALSIGMHTAWNFTQTQLGFTMSGNEPSNSFFQIENTGADWLTGGNYGPEAGFLGLMGFAIMLLMTLLYLNISGKLKFNQVRI